MKKSKVFLAGLAATTIMSMTSCKGGDSKTEDKKTDDVEKLERQQREDGTYYEMMRDSLMLARGYDAEPYCEAINAEDSLRQQLSKMEDENLRKTELQNKIEKEVNSVGQKYEKQIQSILDRYQLSTNEETAGEISKLCNYESYADWRAYKYEYSSENENPGYYWLQTVDDMLAKTNIEKYGEPRQKEIKDAVLKVCKIMHNEQDTKRVAIAKSYADYYPVLNPDRLPAEYAKMLTEDKNMDPFYIPSGEGEPGVGYNYLWNGSLAVTKRVSVYDSKLPVEFFNEEGAKYKLKKIKEGEWQVEKTKDGKISRTPIFKDNVDYKTSVEILGEGHEPHDEFSYEPGTNMGVRVSVNEILFSIKAKDDRIRSPEEMAVLRAPLEKEHAKCVEIIDHYNNIEKQAKHEADSLVKVRQSKRGDNGSQGL